MRLFKKKTKSNEIKQIVIKKDAIKNSLLFAIGTLISALSFNLFYVPNNFVGGGLGGVAVIFNKLFSLDSTLVIFLGNFIFILISIFTLGFKKSLNSIIGASIYTIFVYYTSDVPGLLNFSFDEPLLYVIAAGVVGGFGESLVYKAGFNTGGTSIIAYVIQKYAAIPLGKILRLISFVIIFAGGAVFGYTAIMYSLLITTISTYLVDKMLIGISDSKVFFIQTNKEQEVINFIIEIIESGVTELDSRGAFTNKKKKVLMCVVPTEKYMLLENAIKEIDGDAFIVVSDCYEVFGGTKSKRLLFDE